MKCLKCGTENDANATVCSGCFSQLEQTNNTSVTNETVTPSVVNNTEVVNQPTTPVNSFETTSQPAEPTTVNVSALNNMGTIPQSNSMPQNNTNNDKKDNKGIIIIIIVVFVLIAIGILIFAGDKKDNQGSNKNSNGSNNSNTTTVTTQNNNKSGSEVCGIEREHIHYSDLSDDDKKNLKVEFNGVFKTYTDSKVKSIVFNGKEYDYKEVVECLTDFNKMTEYIATNASFTDDGTYAYQALTPEIVAYYLSRAHHGSRSAFHEFYVLPQGEELTQNSRSPRAIEVSWEFPYKIDYEQVDNYYILNIEDYGKKYSSLDRIIFNVDGVNIRNTSEDFGIVLEDGRYVHLLDINDGSALLRRQIYVQNNTYDNR